METARRHPVLEERYEPLSRAADLAIPERPIPREARCEREVAPAEDDELAVEADPAAADEHAALPVEHDSPARRRCAAEHDVPLRLAQVL